jgi:fructose-1,6-bisphosphatase II
MPNDRVAPERNLALELVRVTEVAAIAASEWVGRGDKLAADAAAVDAMREFLASVRMDGVVVIGEGEKDEAPMLFNGERVGNGNPPHVDIAVDPIDGTTLTAYGRGGAVAVIAVAESGALFDPGPCVYMEKIAVGALAKGRVSLDLSIAENLKAVAKAKGVPVTEITAVVLDRPRHQTIIEEIRQEGARIYLIGDGDVAGAIATAWPESTADILFGIGGTPEGVLAAAALNGMGGEIQGKLYPRNEQERAAAIALGYDLNRTLVTEDLCAGEHSFFSATGITDGDLLRGVATLPTGVKTHSLITRSSTGTVRFIETYHNFGKVSS